MEATAQQVLGGWLLMQFTKTKLWYFHINSYCRCKPRQEHRKKDKSFHSPQMILQLEAKFKRLNSGLRCLLCFSYMSALFIMVWLSFQLEKKITIKLAKCLILSRIKYTPSTNKRAIHADLHIPNSKLHKVPLLQPHWRVDRHLFSKWHDKWIIWKRLLLNQEELLGSTVNCYFFIFIFFLTWYFHLSAKQ